jgi:hypothetical protein
MRIKYDRYLNDIDEVGDIDEVEEYINDDEDEFDPSACPRCGSTATLKVSDNTRRCLEEGCGLVFEDKGGLFND